MEKKQLSPLVNLLDIVVRRKELFIAFVLIGISAGLGIYLVQPKVYQSASLLSYQQQKVNPDKMKPDLEKNIKTIVSTLTQVVTSRTSLEKIIVEEGLYQKERATLPMEDVVELMRRNITITPSKDGDTFSIQYMGSIPSKVVRVTNALSARFVEENMQYREDKASETSQYTQEELDMSKDMLDKKEAVMRDYKLKNFNEMAEQRESNTTRLIALQNQYQSRLNSIQDLERTRVLIREQLALRKQLLENQKNATTLSATEGTPVQVGKSISTLDHLKNELQQLQSKYTEQHPRIISLKKRIADMEQKAVAETVETLPGKIGPAPKTGEVLDKAIYDLELQFKDITMNIEKINKEKVEIQAEIEKYDKWVSMAPIREAEWAALTREHGELKRRYDFLVGQNLQAKSALNLERKQRGSQFKIEDPGQQPIKPIKPDFLKTIGIACAAGFGVAGALSLLLEKVSNSFRRPEELEAAFGLSVICSVPRFALRREVIFQRMMQVFVAVVFLVYGAGLLGTLFYFWRQGRIVF